MTNNLTLVAALPSGGGCMSALSPEIAEIPWRYDPCCDWYVRGDQIRFGEPGGPWIYMTVEEARQHGVEPVKVQMKAAYFSVETITIGSGGCGGGVAGEIDWTGFDLSGLSGGFGC